MIFKICILFLSVFPHPAYTLGKHCLASLATVQTVTSCPTNEAELSRAKQRKQCQHLAFIQKCATPAKFKYHCVLNTWNNDTVEVCAPEIISQGFCLKFDEGGARLQEVYERECTNYSKPCTTRFSSSDLLHYFQCNDIVRKTKKSDILNTAKDMFTNTENTEIEIYKILFGVVLATNIITIAGTIVYNICHFIRKGKEYTNEDEAQDLQIKRTFLLKTYDYNKTVFTEGMMKFAIEKLIPTLSQHGVDCVETFCSLTESDLKNIGLNIGEVKKCNLAARHMKDKKDCCPNQTDEADSKTDDE